MNFRIFGSENKSFFKRKDLFVMMFLNKTNNGQCSFNKPLLCTEITLDGLIKEFKCFN